jgi:choline kinase
MYNKKYKVIILAAGMGTRLSPFTDNRPKCLVEICGKTLLDHQLKVLNAVLNAEIVVVGGYKYEMLQDPRYVLRVNPIYASTNMVETLFSAQADWGEKNTIISYGDIIYEKNILNLLVEEKTDISIAVDMRWKDYWRDRTDNILGDVETLKFGKHNEIVEIGGKPSSLDVIEGQYIGLIKLSPRGAEILKTVYENCVVKNSMNGRAVKNAYMTDLLQETINQGYIIKGVNFRDDWVEIDSSSDLHLPLNINRVNNISNN